MAEAVSTPLSYWEARKNFLYYQVVRIIATGVASDAKSVLDVGSSGCPYLDWFPGAAHRTSLDLRKPYVAEGIASVTTNYLHWDVDRQYDLVLCLQVLEHVRDAGVFAQKLLASGKIVVASVPYKWSEGSVSSHVHDPVDEAKMRAWFGREPNYSHICTEVNSGARRLICVYDAMPQKWRSLKQRDILLGKPQPEPRPKTAKQLAALENKRRNRKKAPVSLMRRAKNLAKRILGRV
ncbi:MAG: hypothetical protein ABIY37_02825 [Devosia sp.]